MTTTREFYAIRAAEARADADAAVLANVRDRCLRAAAPWLSMAQRQDLTDAGRARRDKAAAPLDAG